MGGGGNFYDREVTDSNLRTTRGFTTVAEETFSKDIDPMVLPKDRRLTSTNKSPLVCPFDDTGSVEGLPKILCDKWPMIVGQLAIHNYLNDPMISLAVIGDMNDRAPIQICDFTKPRFLDPWLQKLYLEKGGRSNGVEGYALTAYYYARLYDMKNAVTPIFIFTGDEGYEDALLGRDLEEHFGGKHKDVSSIVIFRELQEKFRGNVFMIRRNCSSSYGSDGNRAMQKQWEATLKKECVIPIKTDLAIGDIMLGVIALAGGARTLDAYINDIRTRPLEMAGKKYEPQSEERIAEVRASLSALAEYCSDRPKLRAKADAVEKKSKGVKTAEDSKKASSNKKAKPALKKSPMLL